MTTMWSTHIIVSSICQAKLLRKNLHIHTIQKKLRHFKRENSSSQRKAALIKAEFYLSLQQGLVAQRITRPPTERKIAGSNPV